MLLHERKISVVMQQPMVVLDAECADDEVCSLANRNAQISQRAVIPSDSRREVGPKSGTMTYWRNPRSTRAAWASSRAPWRTSSRMRSPTRSGSRAAAASSFAVAWVWRPRKCAIQTDVSTRIMACQGCDPHASRPTRLPSPIPWAPPTLRPACVSEPATEGLLPPLLFWSKSRPPTWLATSIRHRLRWWSAPRFTGRGPPGPAVARCSVSIGAET